MTNLTDTVALALANEEGQTLTRPHHARYAKAAIEAVMDWMAEPSPAMIDRFVSRALQVSVQSEGGWSNYARQQWKTMLEAARKEALE